MKRDQNREGTLAEFFAASPLRESGLEIESPQDGLRDHRFEEPLAVEGQAVRPLSAQAPSGKVSRPYSK